MTKKAEISGKCEVNPAFLAGIEQGFDFHLSDGGPMKLLATA